MRPTISPRPLIALAGALFVTVLGTRLYSTQAPAMAAAPTPQQIEFFETKIRPLLVESCLDCHTDDEKGGLRLDSREAMVKGGESGPAVVPGDPDNSLLMKAIRH